jgi:cell wall assembly regulator SMI1
MTTLIEKLFSIISKQTGLSSLPFNEGCSDAEIKEAEKVLKLSLPEDYRAFLKRSNGQSDPYLLTFPPDQIVFLSIREVTQLWNELNEYRDHQFMDETQFDDRVRVVLYHPGRIPIAYNESGGAHLFLDYIPGPKGKEGQLVFNINEADLVVLEDSFDDLLQSYVHLLETGKLVIKKQPEEYGQAYWFVSDKDEYVDWEVYRRLKSEA